MKPLTYCTAACILLISLTGCITHRTVTRGGNTVSQKYVIKNPL